MDSLRLRALGLVAAVFALFLYSSCSNPGPSLGTNPKLPDTSSSAGLRSGDSLVVVIQGVPDPTSNNVQIDDRGLISLPYIGTIQAAGVSAAELSQHIRETYLTKKIYMSVDVSVTVTERYVYVGGEVVRPGRIVWTPDLTVAKAVQAAGGFTLYAKEGRVSLVRENIAYSIDVPLAHRNPNEDPRLLPGDSLQVPKSAF